MQPWKVAVIVVAPCVGLLIVAIILIWRYFSPAASAVVAAAQEPPKQEIAGHHVRLYGQRQKSVHDRDLDYQCKTPAQSLSIWRNATFARPFDWANHPALMADALERGWTAFSLSYSSTVASPAPKLWNSCAKAVPEITWEIGPATELMQLIRFNPGLRSKDSCGLSTQILHSALPLPGPFFGVSSFPQEAYFEITIRAEGCEHHASFMYDYSEHEEVTLIPKSSHLLGHSKAASEDIFMDVSEGKQKLESSRSSKLKNLFDLSGASTVGCSRHDANKLQHNLGSLKENAIRVTAIGLTIDAPPPFSLPGSYFGSVGFHSDGQVLLNGYPELKTGGNAETKRTSWAAVNDTLGCGFDPCTKRVFFTLNGEHVGELICSQPDFDHPLYVALGSNYDITVMVNFGQGPFVYTRANSQRTPDPGNRLTPVKFAKSRKVCEDRGDFFSAGRVACSKLFPESENVIHHHAFSEAESDLFDIVLEGRCLQ